MSKSRLRIPWDFLKPTRNSRKEFCHPPFIWLKSLFTMGSHPFWRLIQIMVGKFTENLGFESQLQKVKNALFIFQFSIKNCVLLFLTIFVLQIRYQWEQTFSTCFIWFLNNKTRYQKMVKIKDTQFCVKNLKMKMTESYNWDRIPKTLLTLIDTQTI